MLDSLDGGEFVVGDVKDLNVGCFEEAGEVSDSVVGEIELFEGSQPFEAGD